MDPKMASLYETFKPFAFVSSSVRKDLLANSVPFIHLTKATRRLFFLESW